MAIQNAFSGSTIGKSMQVNVDILGGVKYDDSTGRYNGLAVATGSFAGDYDVRNSLSSSFGTDAHTIIQALNHLKAQSSAVAPAGASGSIQLRNSDGSGFTYEGGLKATSTEMYVPGKLNVTGAMEIAGEAIFAGAIDANGTSNFEDAMVLQSTLDVSGVSSLAGVTATTISGSDRADVKGILQVGGAIDANSSSNFEGAMVLQSTLDVGGLTTIAALDAAGAGDFAGDFSVATDKFTVASASGNTAVAGTLGVTGVSSLAGVTATTISGSSTLAVAGDAEFGSALSVAGNSTVSSVAAAMANSYALIPSFSIQGTDSQGNISDFRLVVSGGILRTIQGT